MILVQYLHSFSDNLNNFSTTGHGYVLIKKNQVHDSLIFPDNFFK